LIRLRLSRDDGLELEEAAAMSQWHVADTDAVGTVHTPAVSLPLVTHRAGERHWGPVDVLHAAPSAAKPLHVPVEGPAKVKYGPPVE
jgi:hypothetical protein